MTDSDPKAKDAAAAEKAKADEKAPPAKAAAKKASARKPAAQKAGDQPAEQPKAEQPKRGPGYDEPAIATEGQLAGEHDGNPNPVMLRFDDHGEGHPLSEAELSGQQNPDLPAEFDRQGYEEKPEDVTSGQLNQPRNFR
jgi:hypothetical protein